MIQYKYGDCIPISELAYKRLKNKGYNPILVAGYVSVNNENLFFEMYNQRNKNKIEHTYLICNKHLIDLTRNQFDQFEGIYEYLKPKFYYKIKGNKCIIRTSLKALNKIS